MRKQKILIVLFAGSLVLPGVVWAGFSGRFDTENNENRKLAEFPEVNLESLGDFPEQFEAYYKDRSNLLPQLIFPITAIPTSKGSSV